jgi:thioredoxin-related protein
MTIKDGYEDMKEIKKISKNKKLKIKITKYPTGSYCVTLNRALENEKEYKEFIKAIEKSK